MEIISYITFDSLSGDFLVGIAAILAFVFSLISFFISSRSSKKRFNYENTIKCIESYHNIFEKGGINDKSVNIYLGLIDEELFFLKHKMFNKKLGKEWISNFINYLPVFYKNDKNLVAINKLILSDRREYFAEKDKWNYLMAFPRVMSVLLVEKSELDFLFKADIDMLKDVFFVKDEKFYLNPSSKIEQEYQNYEIVENIKGYLALLMYQNLQRQKRCLFNCFDICGCRNCYVLKEVKWCLFSDSIFFRLKKFVAKCRLESILSNSGKTKTKQI
jgi:hypothetical protein